VAGLVLAAVAAGLPLSTTARAATPADVPATLAGDVDWVVGQGVVTTAADGTFQPAVTVTRQSMAMYLYRVTHLHTDPPACRTAPFVDVSRTSWYCGAIAWMSASGTQPGGSTLKFSPTGALTRQTLATWLYRVARPKTALPACTASRFSDVPTTSGFCGAIAWAYGQGVLVGSTSTTFGPTAAVSRGVAATALHRLFDVLRPVLGSDVSYPQCAAPGSTATGALPTGQAFGVVGVNGGKPKTTNPCLAAELTWARASSGTSAQPRAQLYVNTANPGKALASSWPTTGTNKYGICANTDSLPCAFEYGRARAGEDTRVAAITSPQSFVWWLDVETDNSWMADTKLNVAVLEGMVDYFRSTKVAGVGLYSSATHWKAIVGTSVSSSSNLYALPSWLAGASDIGQARRNCGIAPLTAGGTVRMTQYTDAYDHNHSCV
jgi:S-layer homology domain